MFGPIVYHINQWDPKQNDYAMPLPGVFYDYELQKTKLPDVYLVEKLGETKKGRDGIKRIKVYWKGVPENQATWEPLDAFVEENPHIYKNLREADELETVKLTNKRQGKSSK
jgi:hypothetical protein